MMNKIIMRTPTWVLLAGICLGLVSPAYSSFIPPHLPSTSVEDPAGPQDRPALAPTSIFRFPVVPGVVISGYFDHHPSSGRVTWYNGMQNSSPSYGYYFSCSSPSMYDFVGCADNVAGEAACANNREVWYDGHHGIDYEYSPNWHTGAVCDPNRFAGITMPVYAPAAGRVQFAGYDPSRPGNGWHIRIKHDLNGNGSYEDDNIRSNFLHFTANALAVQTNQIVSEGQYLGLGGSTGYSSSPHLHFEVQKSSDNFSTSIWSVDPYGWQGPGADPWPYNNEVLWRYPYANRLYLPLVSFLHSAGCPGCGELLRNNGFESGRTDWIESGVDIIASTSHPRLPVNPYAGIWLGWLGGRDNAVDILYQTVRVPEGLSGARLSYYLMVTTAESGGVYDRFYVRLRTNSGDLIEEIESLNNNFLPAGQWIKREFDIPSLKGRQGEQVRISFEGFTDGNTITNFYIDEVYLKATGP